MQVAKWGNSLAVRLPASLRSGASREIAFASGRGPWRPSDLESAKRLMAAAGYA